jgi:hypothetical protein
MMFSVWDHGERLYKYYSSPEKDAATSAPKPKHLGSAALGLSPEQAAWPLPSSAKLVGRGKQPRGYIASTGGKPLGLIPGGISPTKLIIAGVLGYFAYKSYVEK